MSRASTAFWAALEQCPVPTIASIAGACTAAAPESPPAGDLRVETRRQVRFPIARTLGNCMSLSNLKPARRAGRAGGVKDLVFHGAAARRQGRREAGMVTELVDDFAALERGRGARRLIDGNAPLTLGHQGSAPPTASAARARGRRGPHHELLH